MNKPDKKTQQKAFNDFIRAIGSEIEQAQVKLISAANVQMLLHYWKIGHFILFNQKRLGWGGKVIDKISKGIRDKYPEKKGYSSRNLTYMCQFAKHYPLDIINQLIAADKELETPTIAKVLSTAKILNDYEIGQEPPAQIQMANSEEDIITQEPPAQIQTANSEDVIITQQVAAQIQTANSEDVIIGQQAVAQIQITNSEEDIITQQAVAQIQIANSEEDIITQEPLAQIQTANSEDVVIGQQPAAQIQTVNSEDFVIGQQAVAQIQNIPEMLTAITQQPVAQIEQIFADSPISKINWASHVVLMNSKLPLGVRYWYMKQAVEFGWSRNILDLQIASGLFQRQIKKRKVNNFTATLPKPQSDLAGYLLKDPYIFDLAGVKERMDERDVEDQLVTHVTKYLLEMGTGFAFVARQKHFQVGNNDFYADLILYNIKLHAYVVVELKATPFRPEYAGQLNFYVNVVNDTLRGEHDNKTIGLLLCRGKDEVVAKYALEGYNQPIGVSDYQLSKAIPDELKSALPTIEEVEQELTLLLEQKKHKA
ncbi:MAG: PDDEXK nuclease domain-containing protein [Prevotellaceae bacterium]|jgi:predicted nuclease of restriction endonuclease-like (RecB) superfamily|nr:PDDEXK nuclease domain-containing protein [Prevotellaceae bacterium]